MNTTQTEAAARRPSSSIAISPAAAVLLALSLGLCGGYLDVGIILSASGSGTTTGTLEPPEISHGLSLSVTPFCC